MRPPAQLALAVSLALTGSIAYASPAHAGHRNAAKKAKRPAKVAPPVEQPTASDEDSADEAPKPDRESVRAARRERNRRALNRPVREVAIDSDIDGDRDAIEVVDAPAKLRKAAAPPAQDWHVAIGPYLWASSVDANVSLGPASVAAGIDFIQLTRHARYGAEVLAEARFGRFSISGDLMYGVVGVNGETSVGPIKVKLDGTASSLLIDGAAGYLLAGGDHSLLSLEARGGVRYQRTAVGGSVSVAGATVAPPQSVDAGADAVAGARVFVRPFRRFYLSGMLDIGVFGVSNSTWSASADASLRVTSRVLVSLGWRTLTMDRAQVEVVMHGPRAAVQLLF